MAPGTRPINSTEISGTVVQRFHGSGTQRNASPSTATWQTGRQRQVRGHQRLAALRQLPQESDAHAGRLLGVVLEAVEPVGVLEPDLEHGVAGERQPVAATTFTHLDPFIVLERAIAACGIYPAIDPLVSSSRILDLGVVGEEHYAIARRVQPILQKYQSTKKAPTL